LHHTKIFFQIRYIFCSPFSSHLEKIFDDAIRKLDWYEEILENGNRKGGREILVTIITPSYNQGKFLEKAIESVLSQRGNFSLEYIIVDGGSTDESLSIIQKFAQSIQKGSFSAKCKQLHFSWISEPDKGQADALNKGLRMAKGEAIGWINSDDYYNEGTLQKIVTAFNKYPEAGVIYGDCNMVDLEGKVIETRKSIPNVTLKHFQRRVPIFQPAVFFRKSLLSKIGFIDENLQYTMDYEYWVRALKNGIKFQYIPTVLANFRVYEGSKSSGVHHQIFVESLLIQAKYFGLNRSFLENLACYTIGYAQKRRLTVEESFITIKGSFLKEIEMYKDRGLSQFLDKALHWAYLKEGVEEVFKCKEKALKKARSVFLSSPSLFFTKDALVFWIRVFSFHPKFYFLLKNLILKNKFNIHSDGYTV